MIRGWHDLVDTFTGVALLTLACLPVAALVAWALAHRRRVTGTEPGWARRRSVAEVGMVYGTVWFVWMTMLPGSRPGEVPGRLSLVPLTDLPTMGWPGIVGNLLGLAALGAFAPVRFTAFASLPRVLALGTGCSVLIETAQFVLQLDRVSSVDDVLVNTAGALLGALASRRWWRTATLPAGAAPRGEMTEPGASRP
ncbi:hypothetical protein GCM10023175_09060 [Pseudonocardia xishanensis]|uniref:VanZ-like domain-containing protein n=1 Tax=Pseudonocardia xishanensis TaxID=630995 RepID=A0ABP8RHI4_9PSEU